MLGHSLISRQPRITYTLARKSWQTAGKLPRGAKNGQMGKFCGVEDPLTLNEKADADYAYIKNAEKQVTWKDGEQE